ncbi:MAG TPA: hypothetical protein VFO94_10005 [Gammaproteobacteria bacterium]|nr:hypothetical protein [Gammaproteobacteria bacterium]
MRVKDAISNWPCKWTADDADNAARRERPEHLRLLWFSALDTEGWFRVTAIDAEQRGWSTFCRVEDPARWPLLEITLNAKLRASLAEIGAVDLDARPSARSDEAQK